MFGWIKHIKEKAKNVLESIKPILSNDKAADGIMRWPRPVAFFLLVVMFITGWFNPALLLSYATALAAFPTDFWNVVFIVLGSIAGSKIITDIDKIIKR